mgnify:CR=1 FL=1
MVEAIDRLVGGTAETSDEKFIISKLVTNSGARIGAVSRMLISEIEGADQVNAQGSAYNVIRVADHNTSLQGPFLLPMTPVKHIALLYIC